MLMIKTYCVFSLQASSLILDRALNTPPCWTYRVRKEEDKRALRKWINYLKLFQIWIVIKLREERRLFWSGKLCLIIESKKLEILEILFHSISIVSFDIHYFIRYPLFHSISIIWRSEDLKIFPLKIFWQKTIKKNPLIFSDSDLGKVTSKVHQ